MIKWISNYLGTASADPIPAQPGMRIIDVRDMVDKRGNLPGTAWEKIEQGAAHLARGEKVVIRCEYGISRSNAIAAGILSVHQGLPFNDAVREVVRTTGEKDIKIDVLGAVRRAFKGAHGTPSGETKAKDILITGGSGFIGAALVKQLRDSHKVYAPSRVEMDLNSGAVELDLFVKENSVGHLVHLATPRIFTTNRAMGKTLVLLKNVLDVCQHNSVKLIYLSGWEVFSGDSGDIEASEDRVPRPKGVYGETKYLCELLIEQYQKNYGLEHVLLRCGPVYGGISDRPKFILNFMDKSARNEKITTHRYLNGFPKLDLLHIDDLIAALVAVLGSDYVGKLHLGSGRVISTATVGALLVEIMGSRSQIEHREIEERTPNILMDGTRAKVLFGWQARIPFEEGLRRLLAERMPEYSIAKGAG